MILIAHRGLFNGPNSEIENTPEQIELALSKGYDCEVDVWFVKNEWWLGHDKPQYKISSEFIGKQGLWLHCKNLDALYVLSYTPIKFNYFWHQEDDYTLTSTQFIWTYPGKELTRNSIAVQPERTPENWEWTKNCHKSIAGVCTKFVEKFVNEIGTMPIGSTQKL